MHRHREARHPFFGHDEPQQYRRREDGKDPNAEGFSGKPADRKFVMLFSAVEPIIPAVDLQADVNELKKHVRIELHLVKNHKCRAALGWGLRASRERSGGW